MSFLPPLGFAYVVIGFILLGFELLLPQGFLLGIGLGAIVTGVVYAIFPSSWELQAFSFVALSFIAIFFTRKWVCAKSPETGLNSPHFNLVGKSFPLYSAIVKGEGQVKIGDTLWRVNGEDQTEGDVRVISVNALVLNIVKA